MDNLHSIDLSSPLDWLFAEFLIESGIIDFPKLRTKKINLIALNFSDELNNNEKNL